MKKINLKEIGGGSTIYPAPDNRMFDNWMQTLWDLPVNTYWYMNSYVYFDVTLSF